MSGVRSGLPHPHASEKRGRPWPGAPPPRAGAKGSFSSETIGTVAQLSPHSQQCSSNLSTSYTLQFKLNTLHVPSSDPLSTMLPSALTARSCTACVWPWKVWVHSPVLASQHLTAPSTHPVKMNGCDGWHTIRVTPCSMVERSNGFTGAMDKHN